MGREVENEKVQLPVFAREIIPSRCVAESVKGPQRTHPHFTRKLRPKASRNLPLWKYVYSERIKEGKLKELLKWRWCKSLSDLIDGKPEPKGRNDLPTIKIRAEGERN